MCIFSPVVDRGKTGQRENIVSPNSELKEIRSEEKHLPEALRARKGLTKSLQVERVSGTKLLLVQQAEEAARHVHHVLDVEEQAVQVGRRRLQGTDGHVHQPLIS